MSTIELPPSIAAQVELVTGPRALLGSLETYIAATGRNVTVLPPGQVFAYDWHKVQHPVGI